MCRILADCSYRLMLSTEIKLYLLLTLNCKCHFDGHSAGADWIETVSDHMSLNLFSEHSVHTVRNIERRLF